MIKEASLNKVYWFIKKKRFRKKQQIYKMALSLMIDKTIAAYLGLLVIYLICSIFIFGDYVHAFDDIFIAIGENRSKGFWLILTVLPIRYVFRSFQDPGVIFSTTEYQLGMLPFSRERIWLLTAAEKIFRRLVTYALLGAVVILVTPISNTLILSYMVLLLVYDVMMVVPQWKLYQQRLLSKIGWFCAVLIINGAGVLLASPIEGVILFLLIIGLNMLLIRSLFIGVKWEKVTEYSDYKIWNMPLISQASQVKFKRNKKHGIFANSKRNKRPLSYTKKAIHGRLWKIYLSKNFIRIMPLIGALLLMLFVFFWISNWLFQLGIAFAIYAYSSVATTFFSDRFQADILEVLPWDLPAYRNTFFKWAVYGSAVFLVPITVYLLIHWTLWSPLKLVFYVSVFLYVYESKMKKVTGILAKVPVFTTMNEFLGAIFLLGVVFSNFYPVLSIGMLIILFLLRRQDEAKVGE